MPIIIIIKNIYTSVLFLKNGEHALLASYVSGNSIRVYAHTNDRCDENVGSNFDYYYPS